MNERDPWWVWFSEQCEKLEKMRREIERDSYWHITSSTFEPCHVEVPEYSQEGLPELPELDRYGKHTLHRLTHKGVKGGSKVPNTLRALVEGRDK